MTALELARALPDIPVVRQRCRSLAVLEAILNPDPVTRYYAFDERWAPGTALASMRNGAGDAWSIVFSPAGAFLRGFDHESPMSPAANDDELWPGLVGAVPEVFAGYVTEPAFGFDGLLQATVCLWRRSGDDRWHTGAITFPHDDDPDGADWLFGMLLAGTAEAYQDFAEAYYEMPVDRAAAGAVLAGHPLTAALVRRLHPGRRLADLAVDLVTIGCPVTGSPDVLPGSARDR